MQITCPRKELHDAVQLAVQGVSTKTTLPILSQILIQAEGDTLKLIASDLEVWVERCIPAIVGATGAVTAPARIFGDILGGLPDGDVKLTSGDNFDSLVQCGNSRYNIVGLPHEEFPAVPELETDSFFTMPLGLLRDMVRQVSIAVSHDEARPALTGILFVCDGNDIKMVATDTHRLALRSAPAGSAKGISASVSAVIPERAIQMIAKAPSEDSDEVKVTIEGNRVRFEVGGVRLVASLIAGSFPSYDRVIPRENTRKWTLPTEEFTSAVRRVEIVARQDAHRVVLRGQGDRLALSARSEGLGDANEELEMSAEGEELAIAFNGKYVLEALGVVGCEGVVLEMTEALRPSLLHPAVDNPEFLYVVMPMALP